VIVSVLLSFVKNAISNDELALRKRLVKQVSTFHLLDFTTDTLRFGLVPCWVSEFVWALVPLSSPFGTPSLVTSGVPPRMFGREYFA
jgi:hypothetical protein